MTRRGLCFPVGLLLLLAPAACKKDKVVPPDPGGLPPLGAPSDGRRPASAMIHPPTDPSGDPEMPPGHPPVLKGHAEVPDPPAQAEQAGPSQKISGVIRLGDKVKGKVKPGTTLFLVARAYKEGGAPGQVLAVKRLVSDTWPLPFELSQDDVMMAGTAFQGKVVITTRADQDGDAMTKMPGDVEGVSQPLAVGATATVLQLDTLRTEAAGAPSPAGMGGGMGMPPGHP